MPLRLRTPSVCLLALTMLLPTSNAQAAPYDAWTDADLVEVAMLDFVNDPATGWAELEDAITYGFVVTEGFGEPILADAIEAVLAGRPFATVADLWTAYGVGTETLEGLEMFVSFRHLDPAASAVLGLVNQASVKTLVEEVGLSATAANNLVAYRDHGPDLVDRTDDDEYVAFTRIFGARAAVETVWPARSVEAVPYIGQGAILKIYEFAMSGRVVSEMGHFKDVTGTWEPRGGSLSLRHLVDRIIVERTNPQDYWSGNASANGGNCFWIQVQHDTDEFTSVYGPHAWPYHGVGTYLCSEVLAQSFVLSWSYDSRVEVMITSWDGNLRVDGWYRPATSTGWRTPMGSLILAPAP